MAPAEPGAGAGPRGAVAEVVAALTPTAEALGDVVLGVRDAIARGLAGQPSPLKLLPAFVEQPRGDERARVLVVDWGGTRGRAALVELDGRGGTPVRAEAGFAFEEADKTGPAERAFDVVADAVARVADTTGSDPTPLGFAYSFPAHLAAIDRAIALPLTKGWRIGGLEGEDVAALLGAALGRRGLGRVRVAAVANDTVAALVHQSYRERGRTPGAAPAEVGLIVGTGTNQAADLGRAGIRNLESGNFDGLDGVDTPWDRALDAELPDPSPGTQRLEKMAAGHYLGEILRRALVDLGRSTALFRWPGADLETPFSWDGAAVSAMAADASGDLGAVAALARERGADATPAERAALRELARAVGRRSARLIAAALLGTLTFIDPDLGRDHTVAVDGSLYGGFPGFARRVREALAELTGAERASRVHLAYTRDATMQGAAVIAALAAARHTRS